MALCAPSSMNRYTIASVNHLQIIQKTGNSPVFFCLQKPLTEYRAASLLPTSNNSYLYSLMRKMVLKVVAIILLMANISGCLIMDSPHYYRHRNWYRYYVPHPHYHGTGYRG